MAVAPRRESKKTSKIRSGSRARNAPRTRSVRTKPKGFDPIADTVDEIRKEREISIQGLADKTVGKAGAVSRSQLSMWFNGSRRIGSDHVAAVFRALGLEVRGEAPPKRRRK